MENIIKKDRIIISSRGCVDNHHELQHRGFLRGIYTAFALEHRCQLSDSQLRPPGTPYTALDKEKPSVQPQKQ